MVAQIGRLADEPIEARLDDVGEVGVARRGGGAAEMGAGQPSGGAGVQRLGGEAGERQAYDEGVGGCGGVECRGRETKIKIGMISSFEKAFIGCAIKIVIFHS